MTWKGEPPQTTAPPGTDWRQMAGSSLRAIGIVAVGLGTIWFVSFAPNTLRWCPPEMLAEVLIREVLGVPLWLSGLGVVMFAVGKSLQRRATLGA
jgi:hypothetical protein